MGNEQITGTAAITASRCGGQVRRANRDGTSGRRGQLARQRRAVGLTQEQLAAVLGVERSTVYRWESGIVTPRPEVQPKLAKRLGLTPAELASLLAEQDDSTSVPVALNWSDASQTAAGGHIRC